MSKKQILIQPGLNGAAIQELNRRRYKGCFVPEGRPDLKAAVTTCRRLLKSGITPTVIADNTAGFLFARGQVKEVWLAARAADEQGAVCDIGALVLAVLGKRHKVPVFCYPSEGRRAFLGAAKALLSFNGRRTAPAGTTCYVPLQEWVPAQYVRKAYV